MQDLTFFIKNKVDIILEDQLTREITFIWNQYDEYITIRTYKASMFETIINRGYTDHKIGKIVHCDEDGTPYK